MSGSPRTSPSSRMSRMSRTSRTSRFAGTDGSSDTTTSHSPVWSRPRESLARPDEFSGVRVYMFFVSSDVQFGSLQTPQLEPPLNIAHATWSSARKQRHQAV
jgi:hypothetical protein